VRKLLFVLAALTSYFVFVVPALATPNLRSIEICKNSGSPAVTGTFSFQISHAWNVDTLAFDRDRNIDVNVGECSTIQDTFGDTVRVTEVNNKQGDGFYTNDFSSVSAIHTTQPGALDAAIVPGSVDLVHRTVEVNLASSTNDEAIVHFTNVLDPGYYEICKAQVPGAGLDGQSFPFHVVGAQGYTADLSVAVGSCSLPQLAPGGHVNVTEGGAATFVTDISGIGVLKGSVDLADASATLGIAKDGSVSEESVATYTNDSAQLKICKAVENDPLEGLSYSFSTSPAALVTNALNGNGSSFSVTSGAWSRWDPDSPAHCVLAGRYRAGTVVSVTEAPSVGQTLDHVYLHAESGLLVSSGSDFLGNTETFTIGRNTSVLTFVNKLADPGQFKVCKEGVGSGNVTFTIAGPRGTAPDLTQGVDTVSVPIGQCSALLGPYPYAGIQMITETKQAGFAPVSIAVADLDRLVAGSINLPAGSVQAFIGSEDVTVATFTNAAVVPVPPVVTPPADTPAAPAAPAVAAGQSVVASIASLPGSVTKVTKPAAVRKASVVTARLLTTKVGKALQVKVSSPNKTATIRITLLKKAGKTVKVVTRTVQTNKLVRVQNLAIAKTIVAVRVAVIR
jgi:hypothetical protein